LFDMALRPELVLLQKTMVQAEGVARRVDPAFDMWGAAEPVVTHYILRELGPEGVVTRFIADARRTHAALREFPSLVERWKGFNPKDLREVRAGRHRLCWVALGLVAGVLLTALL
jgi:ubiquinone biosynthesis protein